ncbi:MAG: hypothetical protein U0133_20355 [Gemmatimonadales bacterium]
MTLSRRDLGALLAATLTVGALDLSYVWVLWVAVRQKISTETLLQSIATGWMGRAAYQGGLPTAFLGLLSHFLIAAIWCTLFLVVVRSVPSLARAAGTSRGRLLLGVAAGPAIWWCMDLIVLRVSHARPVPVTDRTFWVNTLQHAIMVGPPMGLILGRKATSRWSAEGARPRA